MNLTAEVLVCGIDVGSTNVKVVLVDGLARTVWMKSIRVPRVTQDGQPVTDVTALIDTLERMMIEGWRERGAGAPLAAIAITGVGEDGVPVAGNLRPLDHAIPWFDRRAEEEADALCASVGTDMRAGLPIEFSRTAAKWQWLRKHRPHTLRDAHLWIALTDYPAVWWSQTPFMSQTLAARTACFDVFGRAWIPSLLDACGAPPLPPVVEAGRVVGRVSTGSLLQAGAATHETLVVAGGHDHPIAASAVRRLHEHALVDSLGTANLMYDEVGRTHPRTNPLIAFSVPALGQPGVACLGVFEFSASLEPLRAADSGDALREFLGAAQAPGEPSSASDIGDALQRALGHRPALASTPRPDDIRATIEAAGFYARCMRDEIQSMGAAGSPIFSVGGWSRSDALLQLRASIFGEPIIAVDEEELTALGVALVAQDALSTDGQRVALSRGTRRIEPVAHWRDAYDRIYPEYRASLHEFKALRAA